ncbi:ATP-binding protein [Dongia sp.]|uniref:ATP-binding protein n=1 Tax=Dongia sp. TaxID=1977262 RepID=UPI00375054A6
MMPQDILGAHEALPDRRFRLTRSFAMVAGLVMVAASALLSVFHWHWSLGELEKMAEQNNVNVAQVLSNVLWSRNAPLMEALAAADRETLKDRPEVAQLRGEIMSFIEDAPIARVKIFDKDGDIIFSTDPNQIGWNVRDRPGFATAITGVVKNELARKNSFSLTEAVTVDRDLMSSYIPIYRNGPGSEIVGVFEVYDDVTIFLRDINRGIALQVAIVLLITLGVYLVLIWFVRRGDQLLRAEHARSLELAQTAARAEAASKAKSQFLANMSHELRTPLNSVIGFAEILSAEGFGPLGDKRYLSYAKEIGDGGRNLLTIINNTLDLSKIELGTADVILRPVDPVAVVRGAVAQLDRQIQDSGVAVAIEIDPRTTSMQSDETKLKQILLNVISNGLKFTPAGGKVSIRVSSSAADRMVRFEISDTGIGISAGDVPIALAPFGQVDSALNRRYQGAGLGLPLAKGLAELLGGRLEIAGAPGAGTTVAITLPAQR